MQILLTNDDGIFAPGLAAMYRKLAGMGDVTVVAPADGRSGSSHSITLKPLACNKVDINGCFTGYSVQGAPADCVKLAAMEIHPEPFDLVVAGINSGANIGINIYYSGTVAAAMEGAFLGIGSVAVSLAADEPMDFDAAAVHCAAAIRKLLPVPPGDVININVPKLSAGGPRGVRVVAQSTNPLAERYIRQNDQERRILYKLKSVLSHEGGRCGPATDAAALPEGYVTVTALAADMTDHVKTRRLSEIDWR
jgi:5'-nucleotidase